LGVGCWLLDVDSETSLQAVRGRNKNCRVESIAHGRRLCHNGGMRTSVNLDLNARWARGGLALWLLSTPAAAWAGVTTTPLPVFYDAAASRGIVWHAPGGAMGLGQRRLDGNRPGLSLAYKPGTGADRLYWEADVKLDLSSYTGIALRMRVRDAGAARRVSLYFRSGEGWYAGWFTPRGTDWEDFQLARGDFSTEGTPGGWSAVDRVRIAVWRGNGVDTTIDVTDLRGLGHAIIIIRNARALQADDKEAWSVAHYGKLTADWLARIGIRAGTLDDTDIVNGLPDCCRIAILPYNPGFAAADAPAIQAFVKRGGAIILSYVLPDPLEPLLGIREKGWHAAASPGELHAIRMTADAADGFPATVRQESWNAMVPEPVAATVLGVWQDAGGKDTGIPALTINTNGAFVGHVLTNMDPERKGILLVALMARLRPEMRAALAAAMVAHAERLLHLRSWPDVREFLRAEARRTGQAQAGRTHLSAIETYRARTAALLKTASFGELIDRAEVTRRMLREAYLALLSPAANPAEFRGLWCHSAEGVPPRDWDTVAGAVQRNGFTAVLANVLWAGNAFYPSKVLPVADAVAAKGDLLARCLDACHRNKLEMHAWKVCWNLHGAPAPWVARLRADGRLQRSRGGKEIAWLCPSHPDNFALERDSLLEVADRYPVDGIHLDYIRYENSDACFCEGCRARFAASRAAPIGDWPDCVGEGQPLRKAFLDWRRAQITRLVRAVREALRARHPNVRLSAAVFAGYPDCRDSIGQDWGAWIREGLVDFVCPMTYESVDAEFETRVRRILALPAAGVAIYPGIGASSPGLPPEQVARQIDLLRRLGAPGFAVFQLDGDTLSHHLPALGRSVTRGAPSLD
jgi:uncharacterized lipoprotein YddW (UPF0748 family)